MIFIHVFIFLLVCLVMWKASELVIQGVEKFSSSLKVSSFVTSFLILGILTSITEISVGLNAILDKKPDIFVGNLIGGSFVILLFVIPLLAIFGKGISLKGHLDAGKLLFFLTLIVSPSFIILDGIVSRYDAAFLFILYGLFFYLFQRGQGVFNGLRMGRLEPRVTLVNLGKILVGAVLIYISSKLLVDKTIYFADFVKIPSFLISLLILSIGTNLPELVIAVNSIFSRRTEIAFGDYVGSAAANTLLFGVFAVLYGPFTVEAKGFDITFFIILLGYMLFFLFARSKAHLSRLEGVVLALVYLLFLLFQTTEIFTLSTKI